jgi:rsbT co-antagonist protein RsbR
MAQDLSGDLSVLMGHVTAVVRAVRDGDYTKRVDSDLPEGHPLSDLCSGLNEMIASVQVAQQRSRDHGIELEEKLATFDLQREAIRELSTPIMEVWAGVLCLPVVGVLDSTRSAEMTEVLLRTIVEKKARCAIVDITGIQVMDTAAADHFIRMARAVRLLGAECVLTGINPNIAQTLVHMGIELRGIATHRSLRDALQHYVGRLEADKRR